MSQEIHFLAVPQVFKRFVSQPDYAIAPALTRSHNTESKFRI